MMAEGSSASTDPFSMIKDSSIPAVSSTVSAYTQNARLHFMGQTVTFSQFRSAM